MSQFFSYILRHARQDQLLVPWKVVNCIQHGILSVGSQSLVTLIFTKTTFCQRGNTKRMAHILSNSRSSRPIRTPLKASFMLQNIISMKNYIILELIYRDTRFCHLKCSKCHGWFFTTKWSKWRNSSETLHNDREIFIGSSKHQ